MSSQEDHVREDAHQHTLSVILSPEERVELFSLTTVIMATIRARILESFDDNDMNKKTSTEISNYCTEYFDNWQDGVIEIVGAAINYRSDVALEVERSPSDRVTQVSKDVQPVAYHDTAADEVLLTEYPPIPTLLCALPNNKRLLLLEGMLLQLLFLNKYTAHSRIFLLYLTSSLQFPLSVLVDDEIRVAQYLIKTAKLMSGSNEIEKRSESNKISRRWKIGLAGVAGATVMGVTGGLAAPLVAGAIGSLMGGIGLGTTAAAGLLGALAESGIIAEVNDFAFLPLKNPTNQNIMQGDHRLRVTIAISGWLVTEEDIINPWLNLGHQSETFALRWEVEALASLGTAMQSLVKSTAWNLAKKEIISQTVFSSLAQALWPMALLKIAKVLDNPFSVCMNRADKAGVILADAIINRVQGERPLTLLGYSFGARLIYSCLKTLSERREFGLIENVVMLGSPVPSDITAWKAMRSVVAGRLVNVYSTHDYILSFLYRTSKIQYGIAGIQPITSVNRIENLEVSDIVNGHLKYRDVVGTILQKLKWEGIDHDKIVNQDDCSVLYSDVKPE
ncbi:DUF726 domain-containing protein [Blumeria hordei DH14]|uniref:DUF726 domain-containing protein n=1 Tax=Blumeria graminis f. sp. hordei (strain DH14) TaxID=546991 RepID=N1JAY9_BLUG1|nr:DUF726 domain-containing protein [Blumeria hordei DH14]